MRVAITSILWVLTFQEIESIDQKWEKTDEFHLFYLQISYDVLKSPNFACNTTRQVEHNKSSIKFLEVETFWTVCRVSTSIHVNSIPKSHFIPSELVATVKIKECAYHWLIHRVMVMVAIRHVHTIRRGSVNYMFMRDLYTYCAIMFRIPLVF